MKKLFTILSIIAAFLAIILAVLPLSNLAFVPAILALVFGFIAFYLSKKAGGEIKKIIQFSFLLTIIALTLTIYKAVFTKTEVANTEELQTTETKSEEDAIEELEEIDFEDAELENVDL